LGSVQHTQSRISHFPSWAYHEQIVENTRRTQSHPSMKEALAPPPSSRGSGADVKELLY
jgi:LAS superfamily LD-carboxypeptidase LdcB